jgi:magnesium-transporting ATPase (P-type)
VKVGDVVLYRDNQPIPADAVVVGSAGRTGGFFVSTADLDGESNLKARESVAATSPLMSRFFDVENETVTPIG